MGASSAPLFFPNRMYLASFDNVISLIFIIAFSLLSFIAEKQKRKRIAAREAAEKEAQSEEDSVDISEEDNWYELLEEESTPKKHLIVDKKQPVIQSTQSDTPKPELTFQNTNIAPKFPALPTQLQRETGTLKMPSCTTPRQKTLTNKPSTKVPQEVTMSTMENMELAHNLKNTKHLREYILASTILGAPKALSDETDW